MSTVFLSVPVTLVSPVRLYELPSTAAEWNVMSSGLIESKFVLMGSENERTNIPSLMLKAVKEMRVGWTLSATRVLTCSAFMPLR